MAEQTFQRPFPALTPEQRYRLDVLGYVVVPGVLSREECEEIKAKLIRLRTRARAAVAKDTAVDIGGAKVLLQSPHHTTYIALTDADPALARYAAHPRLVGMAEELLGGDARVTELDAHVNSRDPAQAPPPEEAKLGFHTGTDVPFATHTKHGLFHCSFVKTLTTLNDLGPDDGGTVVVAGSHKIDAPVADVVACAYKDRSLIHRFEAPAGSALLFPETLIHATGVVRSDRERAIVITGYGPPMFPDWRGGSFGTPPLREEFVASIPEEMRPLFVGKAMWTRGPRYRTLAEPVDAKPIELPEWPAEADR